MPHSHSDFIASYYSATANNSHSFLELRQNLEAETCIVGGGYAGLMTALGLVERGHKNVVLLEQHRIGWGASGRNGGFVFGGYSLGPRALERRVGRVAARELYQFTTEAVDLIRKRIADYRIDCDLVEQGVIWANWFKDQKLLLQEQAFMREAMQIDWNYLTPEQLSNILVTDRYHGGLFEKNAMHFHPLNYAQGIAGQLKQQGVRIYENTAVTSISDDSPEKKVSTQRGEVKCKNIVMAAGGYINKLYSPIARSILPIATYVMTTEPLGNLLHELIKTQAAIYDTRFAFDYYRPLKDTRVLWGGRVSASKQTPEDLKSDLREDLLKVYPSLSEVKIDYAWDGWMGYSRHQMAQIGQVKPGVWYGIGFGGHGVAPTTAAGEILASAIADDDQRYRKFSPWGLPWNGGVFGSMAAQASYWWYQTKDWLKEKLE